MQKRLRASLISSAAIALGLGSAPVLAAQTGAYHIVKSVPLGSPERWDYVVFDAPSHRVYVAHGDRVTVVDGHDGKVLGEVVGIPGGTHGIGISAATGKGYTDDGEAGIVVAFDLKSFKVLKRIPARPDADGIAVDARSGHVFVVEGDSKSVQVVDPVTDSVVATIDAGGGLEYAVSGNDGKLYVDGSEKKELIRIDIKTNTVDAHWPMPNCTNPHGLALDTASHRAFVSCANKVMTVVNTDTGAVVATLPIGQGTDAAAFDANRKLAFSSNGEGTVSIIQEVDPRTFVSLGQIRTAATGKTMDLDPATGRLYIAAADIDPAAPVPAGANGRPGRPKPLPGTLKLLFLDPAS